MLVVLTGLSGTGKTAFLRSLAAKGEQTIDLERMASHRGSAFGAMDVGPQPTHRGFARALSETWRATNPAGLVWIEDKAAYLGSVGVPRPLQELVAAAPTLELVAPLERRCARICDEYAGADSAALTAALERITPRLGALRAHAARAALSEGRFDLATAELLAYYDEAYLARARQLRRERIGQSTLDDDPLAHAHAAREWMEARRTKPWERFSHQYS